MNRRFADSITGPFLYVFHSVGVHAKWSVVKQINGSSDNTRGPQGLLISRRMCPELPP
jgi:hypothetical protein